MGFDYCLIILRLSIILVLKLLRFIGILLILFGYSYTSLFIFEAAINLKNLLLMSFFILLSSLSESFEFLVHNEESLLILCFIAFIFFAYSFLSVGFFDDFQKRVSSLEQQLLVVVATRFKVLLFNFNEFFFRKGLVLRFQFILSLLISGFRLGCSVFSSDVKFLINSLFLFQLG